MCGRIVPLRVGAILLLLVCSGCLAGMPTDATPTAPTPATPTTDVNPRTVESPAQCVGNETVPGFGPSNDSVLSTAGGFELSANRSIVARGAPIAFTLENVAGDDRWTGTPAKYVLQRRGESGWTTVTLFREGRTGFNGTAVVHEPGTGFEWSFRASAGGFSTGKYVVCDRLGTGEYRFVYGWERPVAVSFEIVERA